MSQLDFFSDVESKIQLDNSSIVSNVQGLTYIPNYLSQYEHERLLFLIDESNNWSGELKRRVQHYGYKYNYAARSIDASMRIGSLPDWCSELAQRFWLENLTKELPDQVIVNEYLPGQGISKHIDCEPCFGETILSLSLGSDCGMTFTHKRTQERVKIFLEARSLIILKGDARHAWYHAIAPRCTDRINGVTLKRKRRISITFRKVILSNAPKA